MEEAEEEEAEEGEAEDGELDGDELADREERLCSVGAEKVALRDYGQLSAEDLKPQES